MLDGVVDHVGLWLFIVIEIVVPTESAPVPLSVAVTLKLHVCAGTVAVKATVQLAGKPEPVTVGVNPEQLVPLDEQVIV